MPSAGDEGYERTVICPYDRSHEVRIGRMQFHLKKCRRNFPDSPLESCPYNSSHRIHQAEMPYHLAEECGDEKSWGRFTHQVGETVCPVQNLVPVTEGVLPECDENWAEESLPQKYSVLELIKKGVEENPDLLVVKQCVPQKEKKDYRQERRKQFGLQDKCPNTTTSTSKDDGFQLSDSSSWPPPLPVPMTRTSVATSSRPAKAWSVPSPRRDNAFPSTADSDAISSSLNINAREFVPSKNTFLPPTTRPTTSTSSRPASAWSVPSSLRKVDVNSTKKDGLQLLDSSSWPPVPMTRPSMATSPRPTSAWSVPSPRKDVDVNHSIKESSPPVPMTRPSTTTSSPPASAWSVPSPRRDNHSIKESSPPVAMTRLSTTTSSPTASAWSVPSPRRDNSIEDDGFCPLPVPGLGRGRKMR